MKMLIPVLLMAGISHAAETRTKIAVVDTGISDSQILQPYMCENGVKNMTKYGRSDAHGHGSHIVHIIGSRIDVSKYCIVSYKVYHHPKVYKPKSDEAMKDSLKALKDIENRDYKYVNISMSGGYSTTEYFTFKRLTRRGVKVSVAAGNDEVTFTKKRCEVYPACYKLRKNFYVVSAKDMVKSNKGWFTIKEKGKNIKSYGGTMSGSSQATALWTAKLINESKKNRHDK
jgi:hypothetical protein